MFALIALDSAGYEIPNNPDAKTQATRDMYIDEILSRQLPDGGFALSTSDSKADPDLTGMTLQALAKYQSRADVKTATERALECLSNMQDSTGGGFLSWGDESSESAVQVIVALCELGIPMDDPRFVKDGKTLLDHLMNFYIPGKGFEHIIDGGMNQMATEQALYALAAVYRFENSMNSLYDMTDAGVIPVPVGETGTALPDKHSDVKIMPVAEPGRTFADIAGHENKTAIEALAARKIISGMTETIYAPSATMTRAEFATIITRALGLPQKITDIILLLITGCSSPANIETPDQSESPSPVLDKYQTEPVPEGKPAPVEPEDVTPGDTAYTCTLSVRCDVILDNIDDLDPEKLELVPEDGAVFTAQEVTFYEGENVFNVLQREMKRAKIHMEFRIAPIYNSAYVMGIGNLYEFDCGPLSGWMYRVNDWFPNYGCSRYQLQDGDVVEWIYTCDLGRDIGGEYAVGS